MKNPVVLPTSRKTDVTQLVWTYSWCGCTNWKDSANARMKVTETSCLLTKQWASLSGSSEQCCSAPVTVSVRLSPKVESTACWKLSRRWKCNISALLDSVDQSDFFSTNARRALGFLKHWGVERRQQWCSLLFKMVDSDRTSATSVKKACNSFLFFFLDKTLPWLRAKRVYLYEINLRDFNPKISEVFTCVNILNYISTKHEHWSKKVDGLLLHRRQPPFMFSLTSLKNTQK